MKRIAFFTLGGTVSAEGTDRRDLKDYKSGLIDGDFYLKDIPELTDLADIKIIPVDNVSSTEINSKHWIRLKKEIEYYLNDESFDGVVITHGTNTLEETAYFLHLTINSTKPVVLTGSQRPYTALSSDAQLNLFHAFKTAINPGSHGKGVLVTFNQKIHSARDVTKVDTYDLDGFQSGVMGALGYIDAAQDVVYYREPVRKHTADSQFSRVDMTELAAVEIVYSYAGATGNVIDSIAEGGDYAGIVVAGTGAGRFSKGEEKALRQARKQGMHIVRSHRVGNGRILPIEPFAHLDFVSGDNLNPQKARILLMCALLLEQERDGIQQFFHTY
jgi:L-asparaginase